MKRILGALALLLTACQGKTPPRLAVPPPEILRPISPVTAIAADAADVHTQANRYVATAPADQISHITVLTMAMQANVHRMRANPSLANILAAQKATAVLRSYLGAHR
jgi:hypothetical protein